MNEKNDRLAPTVYDETTGIRYDLHGDYYFPHLLGPEQEKSEPMPYINTRSSVAELCVISSSELLISRQFPVPPESDRNHCGTSDPVQYGIFQILFRRGALPAPC